MIKTSTGNVLMYLGLFSLLIIGSCDPSQRYAVLSVFFDGVTDPNKPKEVSNPEGTIDSTIQKTTVTEAKKVEPQYTFHSPYQEKACDNCHDSKTKNGLKQDQPALCYQCHEDFGTKTKYLHGPVAGGFCTACHEPHYSKNAKLVKRTGQALCLYCHSMKDIVIKDVHQGIDDADCTSCHNPHGGDDRFMIQN